MHICIYIYIRPCIYDYMYPYSLSLSLSANISIYIYRYTYIFDICIHTEQQKIGIWIPSPVHIAPSRFLLVSVPKMWWNHPQQKSTRWGSAINWLLNPSTIVVSPQSSLPSGNQTWQWKIHHLWMVVPLKPPFMGDFPLPCLIAGG